MANSGWSYSSLKSFDLNSSAKSRFRAVEQALGPSYNKSHNKAQNTGLATLRDPPRSGRRRALFWDRDDRRGTINSGRNPSLRSARMHFPLPGTVATSYIVHERATHAPHNARAHTPASGHKLIDDAVTRLMKNESDWRCLRPYSRHHNGVRGHHCYDLLRQSLKARGHIGAIKRRRHEHFGRRWQLTQGYTDPPGLARIRRSQNDQRILKQRGVWIP
eukprot:scaffold30108_cov31-Tisochrysis_lutea.AAC.2